MRFTVVISMDKKKKKMYRNPIFNYSNYYGVFLYLEIRFGKLVLLCGFVYVCTLNEFKNKIFISVSLFPKVPLLATDDQSCF